MRFTPIAFNYTYDLSGRRKTLTSVLPTCASVCNETYTQTYNYGLQSGLLQQITDVGDPDEQRILIPGTTRPTASSPVRRAIPVWPRSRAISMTPRAA